MILNSDNFGLGRIEPTDDRHLQKYPLTAATLPAKPSHVVIGVPWYATFFLPVADPKLPNTFWIARSDTPWGAVVGGHAVCLKSPHISDLPGWHKFYNQGQEGACVGFAASRHQSGHNRKRYAAFDLYWAAQKVDEWPGEDYSGTSVRAAFDVMRDSGLWVSRSGKASGPLHKEGISVNRWATSIEDVAMCLSPQDAGRAILNRGWVEFLNSWGTAYPHRTRIELDSLYRLLFRENGDATVATDR